MCIRDRCPPSGPSFPLVAGYGPRLALDARCDCFLEFHLGKPWHSEEGVLRHLTEPAPVLARRQAGEHLGVADHPDRLPERSHQVLALGQDVYKRQIRIHQTDPVEIELSALTRMIERVRAL